MPDPWMVRPVDPDDLLDSYRGYIHSSKTRRWFQRFFMFIPSWGYDPISLIFFEGG